jgi:hypothetical protein
MFPSHLHLGPKNGGFRRDFIIKIQRVNLYFTSVAFRFQLNISVSKAALTECAMESRASRIRKPGSIFLFEGETPS